MRIRKNITEVGLTYKESICLQHYKLSQMTDGTQDCNVNCTSHNIEQYFIYLKTFARLL